MLSLDPASGGFVAAFDVNNNPIDIAPGGDVSFSVLSGTGVPEPGSLLLAAITFALALARAAVARIRSRRPIHVTAAIGPAGGDCDG